MPTVTAIHVVGAKATVGLSLASSFHWDQNDQATSFLDRFFVTIGHMPDVAHAVADLAMHHYLCAVVAPREPNADQINKEMRRIAVYFFGLTGRLCLDGRPTEGLALLRIMPLVPLHSGFDRLKVPWLQLGQGGTVEQNGDAARNAWLA